MQNQGWLVVSCRPLRGYPKRCLEPSATRESIELRAIPKVPDTFSDSLSVVPELLFEVRSPSDRLPKILVKVGEYLEAGVLCVCVVDPETETITVYRPDSPPKVLSKADVLQLHDILRDFRVDVRRFFE